MNKGDAGYIILNIKVNDQPIGKDYADDLEITFNPSTIKQNQVRKTLKNNDIEWDDGLAKFRVFLSQHDTFAMNVGENTWHIRVLKDDSVISSAIGKLYLGNANSGVIL